LTSAYFSNTIVPELEIMKEKSLVYIVDDDPSVRKALKRFVTAAGYSVETFASAQEFLSAIPVYAKGCLILDLRMPGLNGLGLQVRMAILKYKLPIIFITAFDNPQDRKQAMDAGAVAFLQKPFSTQALLDALQAAC
jgi:FixJ family two-component response regulator